MSDPRILPKYTPEVRDFLDRHADTGEPSAEALARVQQLVLTRAVNGAPATKRRPAKRWLAPEFLIAAGLLLATLGGRWWFERLHRDVRPVATGATVEPAEAQAARDAWRAGDFDRAMELGKRCVVDSCISLKNDLVGALVLVKRLPKLSSAELDKLARLDRHLAQGQVTALAAQIDALKAARDQSPPAPSKNEEAEALYREADALKKSQNLDAAIIRLERCVKVAPSYFNCYKMLGSVYAKISARDSSAVDMENARRYYQRFLELAPPDDDAVPKVRAILDGQ